MVAYWFDRDFRPKTPPLPLQKRRQTPLIV
jgi:hypothetical protein